MKFSATTDVYDNVFGWGWCFYFIFAAFLCCKSFTLSLNEHKFISQVCHTTISVTLFYMKTYIKKMRVGLKYLLSEID